MRHTFFGNLPGRFEGSASRLLLRGIFLWVLAVVPLTVGLVATFASIDWTTLGESRRPRQRSAVDLADRQRYRRRDPLPGPDPDLARAVAADSLPDLSRHVSAVVGIGPALRRHRRHLASCRTGQIFGIYLRFFWYAFLLTLAGIVVGFDRRRSWSAPSSARTSPSSARFSPPRPRSACTWRWRSAIRPSIRRP